MPVYSYKCQDCDTVTDSYRKVDDRNNCPVCECGGETKKIISGYSVVTDLEPYLDQNIGSEPIWVKSKQHRKKLMKDNGVSEVYGKGWR